MFIRLILRTFNLGICNPLETPTHSRGAALDLVLASPGLIESVCVHNRECACENASLCCPLLSSDHFALEIRLLKRSVRTVRTVAKQTCRVRGWDRPMHAQKHSLLSWPRQLQAELSNSTNPADPRAVLDKLYEDLLTILWNADASLYRGPRKFSNKQPS